MGSLIQKVLFRHDYFDLSYFKEEELPIPLFFGIPTLAFKVRVTTVVEKRNFLQETILHLKNTGLQKNEIAEMLCLKLSFVNLVIENDRKSAIDDKSPVIEQNNETKDFFIFYNLLTNEFIKGYLDSGEFFSQLSDFSTAQIDHNQVLYHRKSIGDSMYTRIHILGQIHADLQVKLFPTQKDILSCHKSGDAFNEIKYVFPEYLNYVEPVYLLSAYSVTTHNSNQYSAINPFFNQIRYSTYFYNIIKDFGKRKIILDELKEYESLTKNNLIKSQNQRLVIKNDRQKQAYEYFRSKYENYPFFNDSIQKFMVSFETEYQTIMNNVSEKNISSNVRVFYDSINNALEELLKITVESYQVELEQKLSEDRFFEKIGIEKMYSDEKAQLNKYFENLPQGYTFERIKEQSSPEQIAKVLKKQSLRRNYEMQLNIYNLFTINLICLYYIPKAPFHRLLAAKIDYIEDTIINIMMNRKEARHTYNDLPLDYIKATHDNVIQMIDVCMNVKHQSKEIVITEVNDKYEDFIGEYPDLEDLPESLQNACNVLLRDVFNASELYFSDCVIAFETLSNFLIDFAMRRIKSIEDLNGVLKLIPNEEEEAIFFLIEKLPFDEDEKESVLNTIHGFRVDVMDAKKSISNNYKSMRPSTRIIFAPIFLAAADYIAFVSFFQKTERQYFEDAVWSINERKHSEQATDWKSIKMINENFINYCKSASLLNLEE